MSTSGAGKVVGCRCIDGGGLAGTTWPHTTRLVPLGLGNPSWGFTYKRKGVCVGGVSPKIFRVKMNHRRTKDIGLCLVVGANLAGSP